MGQNRIERNNFVSSRRQWIGGYEENTSKVIKKLLIWIKHVFS